MRSRYKTVLLIPLAVATIGCVNVVDIDVDDSTRFGTFATSFPASDDGRRRIRIRGTRTSGELNQSLDSFERIRLDGGYIDGPAELDGEIELTHVSIALGSDTDTFGFAGGGTFSSMYIGLSGTRFDLLVDDGSATYSKHGDTTELYLQYGLYQQLAEALAFGFTWEGSIGRGLSGISAFDLKLEYALARQLRIEGGYRWFYYSYDIAGEDSNIRVELNGPFIGLGLPF